MLVNAKALSWLAGVPVFFQGAQTCPLKNALGFPSGSTYAGLRKSPGCETFSRKYFSDLMGMKVLLSTEETDMW